MRIREMIEYLQALEKTLGNVLVEGNQDIKLLPIDILFVDRDDNVLMDYGKSAWLLSGQIDWSGDNGEVCSIRIRQED